LPEKRSADPLVFESRTVIGCLVFGARFDIPVLITRHPTIMADSYLTLLETLRGTLVRIEEKEKLDPQDPALRNLKRWVALMIAELELCLQKDAA